MSYILLNQQTRVEPGDIRKDASAFLQKRHELGQVVLHDLIEPMYNLSTLAKRIAEDALTHDVDRASLDLAVELSNEILSGILRFHNLAYNSDRLSFVAAFDLNELIRNVVYDQTGILNNIKINFDQARNVRMIGDKELLRFWLESIFTLCASRLKNSHFLISLDANDPLLSTVIFSTKSSDMEGFVIEEIFARIKLLDSISTFLGSQLALTRSNDELIIRITIKRDGSAPN